MKKKTTTVEPATLAAIEPTPALPEKWACQLDAAGFYVGLVKADPSPLETDVYLIPGGAIYRAPPAKIEPGYLYRPGQDVDWVAVQDLRHASFFLTSDGSPYIVGVELDGRSFAGIGAIPDWLTQTPRPNEWSVWVNGQWADDAELRAAALTAERVAEKSRLMEQAGVAIAPLQDAHDLDIATESQAESLALWKRYRVALAGIDPADLDAAWPKPPQ